MLNHCQLVNKWHAIGGCIMLLGSGVDKLDIANHEKKQCIEFDEKNCQEEKVSETHSDSSETTLSSLDTYHKLTHKSFALSSHLSKLGFALSRSTEHKVFKKIGISGSFKRLSFVDYSKSFIGQPDLSAKAKRLINSGGSQCEEYQSLKAILTPKQSKKKKVEKHLKRKKRTKNTKTQGKRTFGKQLGGKIKELEGQLRIIEEIHSRSMIRQFYLRYGSHYVDKVYFGHSLLRYREEQQTKYLSKHEQESVMKLNASDDRLCLDYTRTENAGKEGESDQHITISKEHMIGITPAETDPGGDSLPPKERLIKDVPIDYQIKSYEDILKANGVKNTVVKYLYDHVSMAENILNKAISVKSLAQNACKKEDFHSLLSDQERGCRGGDQNLPKLDPFSVRIDYLFAELSASIEFLDTIISTIGQRDIFRDYTRLYKDILNDQERRVQAIIDELDQIASYKPVSIIELRMSSVGKVSKTKPIKPGLNVHRFVHGITMSLLKESYLEAKPIEPAQLESVVFNSDDPECDSLELQVPGALKDEYKDEASKLLNSWDYPDLGMELKFKGVKKNSTQHLIANKEKKIFGVSEDICKEGVECYIESPKNAKKSKALSNEKAYAVIFAEADFSGLQSDHGKPKRRSADKPTEEKRTSVPQKISEKQSTLFFRHQRSQTCSDINMPIPVARPRLRSC